MTEHDHDGTGRPLSEIVADVEDGIPLAPAERNLVTRLAALIPPRDGRAFLTERDELVREIVATFAPPGSTAARARWLAEQFARFAAGADWKLTRLAVLPPYSDPLRAQLWRLAQLGRLPSDRTLREILTGA